MMSRGAPNYVSAPGAEIPSYASDLLTFHHLHLTINWPAEIQVQGCLQLVQ